MRFQNRPFKNRGVTITKEQGYYLDGNGKIKKSE